MTKKISDIPIQPPTILVGLLGVKVSQAEFDYGGTVYLTVRRLEEIERRILAIEAKLND